MTSTPLASVTHTHTHVWSVKQNRSEWILMRLRLLSLKQTRISLTLKTTRRQAWADALIGWGDWTSKHQEVTHLSLCTHDSHAQHVQTYCTCGYKAHQRKHTHTMSVYLRIPDMQTRCGWYLYNPYWLIGLRFAHSMGHIRIVYMQVMLYFCLFVVMHSFVWSRENITWPNLRQDTRETTHFVYMNYYMRAECKNRTCVLGWGLGRQCFDFIGT